MERLSSSSSSSSSSYDDDDRWRLSARLRAMLRMAAARGVSAGDAASLLVAEGAVEGAAVEAAVEGAAVEGAAVEGALAGERPLCACFWACRSISYVTADEARTSRTADCPRPPEWPPLADLPPFASAALRILLLGSTAGAPALGRLPTDGPDTPLALTPLALCARPLVAVEGGGTESWAG